MIGKTTLFLDVAALLRIVSAATLILFAFSAQKERHTTRQRKSVRVFAW